MARTEQGHGARTGHQEEMARGPPRERTGVLFALLFTLATGLHVVPTDRGPATRYPRRCARSGRTAPARSSFGWFLAGLTLYAGLLAAVTAAAGEPGVTARAPADHGWGAGPPGTPAVCRGSRGTSAVPEEPPVTVVQETPHAG